MRNYKIIHNVDELQKFIDILPDLSVNECFDMKLFARKKYGGDELVGSKITLGNRLVQKEHIISTIKRFEIGMGQYDDFGGNAIDENCLAIYINPNPRDMRKASVKINHEICEKLYTGEPINPKKIAEKLVQKTRANRKDLDFLYDFDFDFKGVGVEISDSQYIENLNRWVIERVGDDARVHIIETRGGAHVLVGAKTVGGKFKKNWIERIKEIGYIDTKNTGDQLIPIPGCCQGEYVPKLIK